MPRGYRLFVTWYRELPFSYPTRSPSHAPRPRRERRCHIRAQNAQDEVGRIEDLVRETHTEAEFVGVEPRPPIVPP